MITPKYKKLQPVSSGLPSFSMLTSLTPLMFFVIGSVSISCILLRTSPPASPSFLLLHPSGKILVGTHRGNVFSTLSNTDTSSKTSSLGWRDAQVDISLEDGTRWYKLTFTAQSGGREAWVALDDIRITHQSCYSFSKPDKPIDSGLWCSHCSIRSSKEYIILVHR